MALASASEWWGTGVFKARLLDIHLGGRGLTVVIGSCKLHNNRLYCTCLSQNSVCYNQTYIRIEYLWTLWGHSCASRAHVWELEKPLRLVCIHCVPSAHALALETWESLLWLFCSISVSFPGPHWGLSEVGFRDQLDSFSAKLPLVAHAWLPNTGMYYFFFRCKDVILSLQYGINQTFTCTGKPKKIHDSHYGDICFIAVVSIQTHNMSELFLCAFLVPIIILSFTSSNVGLVTAPIVIPGVFHNSVLLFLNPPTLFK